MRGLSRARRTRVEVVTLCAYRRFVRCEGATHAAALTYYVLLSVFPLLLCVISVFGLVVRDRDTQMAVLTAIVRQAPAGPKMQQQLVNASLGTSAGSDAQASALGVVALGTAVWSASLAFAALRRALNAAFAVAAARPFIHARAIDLASMLGGILFALCSVALVTSLGELQRVAAHHLPPVLDDLAWTLAYGCAALGLSWVGVLALLRLVPNHRLGWRALRWPALMAAVGWEVAKVGFSIYIAQVGNYQRIYGTLGGVIALLIVVFAAANIVIFAAALAATAADTLTAHPSIRPRA